MQDFYASIPSMIRFFARTKRSLRMTTWWFPNDKDLIQLKSVILRSHKALTQNDNQVVSK